jgi:hypothetical protein
VSQTDYPCKRQGRGHLWVAPLPVVRPLGSWLQSLAFGFIKMVAGVAK